MPMQLSCCWHTCALTCASRLGSKTLKILAEGLKCILCIGELKEERESGETFNVCDVQVQKAGWVGTLLEDESERNGALIAVD